MDVACGGSQQQVQAQASAEADVRSGFRPGQFEGGDRCCDRRGVALVEHARDHRTQQALGMAELTGDEPVQDTQWVHGIRPLENVDLNRPGFRGAHVVEATEA